MHDRQRTFRLWVRGLPGLVLIGLLLAGCQAGTTAPAAPTLAVDPSQPGDAAVTCGDKSKLAKRVQTEKGKEKKIHKNRLY